MEPIQNPNPNPQENNQADQPVQETILTNLNPSSGFDFIVGLEKVKMFLKEHVILPIKFPKLFEDNNKQCYGVLLYGPPGVGKTMFQKAIEIESGIKNTENKQSIFRISSHDLYSVHAYEPTQIIKQTFKKALENKPSIIFLDEIDSIFLSPEDSSELPRRIKTEFLVQMHCILHNSGVFVIADTNAPWKLDPAIRRRFERRILVPLLDASERLTLIKAELSKFSNTFTEDQLKQVSQRTEGYTGSDIIVLVRDTCYSPVRLISKATHFKETINADGKKKFRACDQSDPEGIPKTFTDFSNEELEIDDVSFSDFETTLERVKHSVSSEEVDKHYQFQRDFDMI